MEGIKGDEVIAEAKAEALTGIIVAMRSALMVGEVIRRYEDRDHYHESRNRRHRSTTPGYRRGRSRSSDGKRKPVREGSE